LASFARYFGAPTNNEKPRAVKKGTIMINTNRARWMFLSAFLALLLVVFAGLPAAAAGLGNTKQFAIEMKMATDTDETASVTYYVGKNRLRMDITVGGMPGSSHISIYDGDQVTMYMLMPQMKQYIKKVGSEEELMDEGPALPFGSPEDADHPCQSSPDTSCKKTRSDTLLGRAVDVYFVRDIEDGVPTESTVWFDRELLFPIKVEDKDGIMEATSIKVGAQPDRLFKIPAGYTEMNIPY
jgi:outer membrane lipoprotein-sorting protein